VELVLAKLEDLNKIKEIYTKIIENMYINDIKIWNEYYPNEVFESDIEKKNLYLLKDNDNILGAFVINEHENIEEDVEWEDKTAKAYLINRVGVNTEYLRQGIGQKIINEAATLAKEKGAKYLRLLVSEFNNPAVNLYSKCKFNKVSGIHKEEVRTGLYLNEYGFEMRLE